MSTAPRSSALLTDRYELTMLDAAIGSGMHERECVFEVFSRRLPDTRRYGVVAGTGRITGQIGVAAGFERDFAEVGEAGIAFESLARSIGRV